MWYALFPLHVATFMYGSAHSVSATRPSDTAMYNDSHMHLQFSLPRDCFHDWFNVNPLMPHHPQVRGELEAARARGEALQAAGEAAVGRFKALLRQYAESTKELVEMEVRGGGRRGVGGGGAVCTGAGGKGEAGVHITTVCRTADLTRAISVVRSLLRVLHPLY